MKEHTIYECDICGAQYLSREECEDCEKRHVDLMPVEITNVRHPYYRPMSGYPPKVWLRLKNGQIWGYEPIKQFCEPEMEKN